MEKLKSQNFNKEFLQSNEWRKFQEAFGRRTFCIDNENFHASIIEHNLPIAGRYFYIPKGPILSANAERISNFQFPISNKIQILKQIRKLINLAKENKAGWVRFDPENEEVLEIIKGAVGADLVSAQKGQVQDLSLPRYKITKAPHDVQPKQIFVIDISKKEEEILAQMKSKTRYNIHLAEKKGVQIKIGQKYLEDFLRLTKIMAKRQGIAPHPDEYYRKMLEIIPEEIMKLYVAEYDGKIIAANIMVFYGDTAIYLHGASDEGYRQVMAPFLLQWRSIQDAKKAGCAKYDFGGVKAPTSPQPSPQAGEGGNLWAGITRFKVGFAPDTQPTEFPGSYDIIINPARYWLYRVLQGLKNLLG